MISLNLLFLCAILAILHCAFGDSFFHMESKFRRSITVYRNGGNNTASCANQVAMEINAITDDFAYFKARAGVKLGLIPHECQAYSLSRPRRPMAEVCPPVHPEFEPLPECGYTTWTDRVRVYTHDGVLLQNLHRVANGDTVYVVGAGDHFFWPGEYVGRKLTIPDVVLPNGHHAVLETLSLEPRIFLIENFVSDDEASQIIEAAKPRMVRSRGFEKGKHVTMEARTSEQTWLVCNEEKDKFLCDIDERIAKVLRIPLKHVQEHSDALQVVHYNKEQHYHSHHDFFDPTLHPVTPGLKEGYNRMITLLWYLSDVAEGGETVFPLTGENAFPSERQVTMSSCERGLKVRPKKGAALLWYNMLPHGNGHEGRPDRQSLHGGCDVLAGEKWASNKWVYNHKWDNRDLVDTHVEGMARRRDEPVRQPAYPTMEELEQATGAGAGDARAPNEIDAAFVNKHDKAVKLFWIGNGGEELEMATIAVGGSQPFNTYATHQWVARDIDSGQAVSKITISANTRQYFIKGDAQEL